MFCFLFLIALICLSLFSPSPASIRFFYLRGGKLNVKLCCILFVDVFLIKFVVVVAVFITTSKPRIFDYLGSTSVNGPGSLVHFGSLKCIRPVGGGDSVSDGEKIELYSSCDMDRYVNLTHRIIHPINVYLKKGESLGIFKHWVLERVGTVIFVDILCLIKVCLSLSDQAMKITTLKIN